MCTTQAVQLHAPRCEEQRMPHGQGCLRETCAWAGADGLTGARAPSASGKRAASAGDRHAAVSAALRLASASASASPPARTAH
jgi:hypothetical protein